MLDSEGSVAAGPGLGYRVLFLDVFIECEKTLESIVALTDQGRLDTVPFEIDESIVEQALPKGLDKALAALGIIRHEVIQVDGRYPGVF